MSLIANASGTPANAPDGITTAANRGTVASPLFRSADASTGLYSPGTNQFALASNGVLSWLVDASGAHTFGASSSILHTFQGSQAADYQVKIVNNNNTNGSGLRVQSGTNSSATTVQAWFGSSVAVGNVNGAGTWALGDAAGTSGFHSVFGSQANPYGTGFNFTASFRATDNNTARRGVFLGFIPATQTAVVAPDTPAAAAGLAFGSFSGTQGLNVGGYDSVGAWVLGTSTSTNNPHLAQGSPADSHTLRIRNHNNNLRADGLTISLANANVSAGILGSTQFIRCFNDSAGETRNSTERFVVRADGNVYNVNNTYGATSDIALKENIQDARGYLSDLSLLRVVKYNRKDTPDLSQLGLIAQEVEAVFPGLVDGEEGGKSVKYSVINIMMLKAIQELKLELDAAKARIATLEGV